MTICEHSAIPPDLPAVEPRPVRAPDPMPRPTETCSPGPHEPSFVLLGRDPQAPALVDLWADQRSEYEPDWPKIQAARDIADKMRRFKGFNLNLGPPAAPMPLRASADSESRWEVGFRNIVCHLRGARKPFDIPEVVEEVRRMAERVAAVSINNVVTEESLKEAARRLGWYIRESRSVPKIDGGWRHPFSITVDAGDLATFINHALTDSALRVEYRDVDLQLLKRGLAFVEAFRQTYFGDCSDSMATYDPQGNPPSLGSSFDQDSWLLIGMFRKALDHAHEAAGPSPEPPPAAPPQLDLSEDLTPVQQEIMRELREMRKIVQTLVGQEESEVETRPFGWVYTWTDDDCDGGMRYRQFSRNEPDTSNPYISEVVPLWDSPRPPAAEPRPPSGIVAVDLGLMRRILATLEKVDGTNADKAQLDLLVDEVDNIVREANRRT